MIMKNEPERIPKVLIDFLYSKKASSTLACVRTPDLM
jgi:hypothetical protein